jgi:hypothetical protein
MKRVLIVLTMIFAAAAVFAAESRAQASGVTPAAQEMIEPVPTSEPPFGALFASATTACAKAKVENWQSLSPIDPGNKWYFRMFYKDHPNEIKKVTGFMAPEKIIDGKSYYYYSVPEEKKGNLVRFSAEGGFLKNLDFPIFNLIFLDVSLSPEIQYLRFPVTAGDSWTANSTGTVDLLNFIKIKKDTVTEFHVIGEADVTLQGKKEHVFMVKDRVDKGNGKYATEEAWYAVGIGLIYQETEAYVLELYGFEPANGAAQTTKQAGPSGI